MPVVSARRCGANEVSPHAKATLPFIALLTIVLAGCRTTVPEVDEGAASPVFTAVGPIPGAPKNVRFRTNPFANDPVALQEGRKLFNWYNCSGCHGGHAGGGMGPSLRDKVWLFGDRDDQIL